MTDSKATIVVLGGGFAGRATAQRLSRLLSPQEAEIILVDQNDFSLFTPMLPEVAGGEVDGQDIVASLHALSPRVRFQQGHIEEIDVDQRRAVVCLGVAGEHIPQERRVIQGDQLVVALGSVTNFHGIPGLSEYALTVKTVEDANTIRNRAIIVLQRASEESDPERRAALLTFVVGGAGFSGVETAAAVNDLVRDISSTFVGLHRDDIRMVLVQPGDRILTEISSHLARYAHAKLTERGIEVMLNTSITGAGDGWIEIQDQHGDKRRIDTFTPIWAAGITPPPVIQSSSAKLGRHHGIVTDYCCAVPGHPGVWALGDSAEIPMLDGKGTYAPTAQNAIREGSVVAQNVASALRGGELTPFIYHPAGEMAIVGKRSGVASLYGLHLAGFIVWVMWRIVYLAKLPGAEKRVRVALDWILDLIFGRDSATLPGRDFRDLVAARSDPHPKQPHSDPDGGKQ
jgi:NADH dehydrogenase